MTKKQTESSKESSKSSSLLSIEQAKHKREALVAMHKRCRKWGRTVTKVGGRLVQGSLFDFPEEKEHKPAVPLVSDVVAPASDEEVQMTKKPSESSKEPSKSSDPPPKEPRNYLLEATEAWEKELRDSGTIVTDLGGLDIQGSQFIFPARKARKKAAPLDDDVKEATDRG